MSTVGPDLKERVRELENQLEERRLREHIARLEKELREPIWY